MKKKADSNAVVGSSHRPQRAADPAGLTMVKWRDCKLGDLLEIKHGFAFLGEHFASAGTHVVLTPGNFYDEGGFKVKGDKEKWYNGPVPAEYVLSEGDLIIAMTEQAEGLLGSSAIVPRSGLYLHNQRLGLVQLRDANQADKYFVYYLFNSKPVRQQIRGSASGTKIRHTAPSRIAEVRVSVPPLPMQRRIAGILSAYDDLIENSQRRIRILEAMARALYREWFVHFRFPGHKNHPRVASPLGDIPNGWEVGCLDALKAEQPYAINGGPFGSKLGRKDYVAEGVPVVRGSNLSESGRFDPRAFVFVSEEKAQELRANLASPGDIVVTQRGTLGQIGMIPSGIGHDRFLISQSQMKITLNPRVINREYAFFYLRSEEATQRIKNLASSSGVPHINLTVLREFRILLPPLALQQRFGELALGTEAAIETLQRQSHNLSRTRNLLLSRLLSGQVELETEAA